MDKVEKYLGHVKRKCAFGGNVDSEGEYHPVYPCSLNSGLLLSIYKIIGHCRLY